MCNTDDASSPYQRAAKPSRGQALVRYGFLPAMLFGANGLGGWLAWSAAPKWVLGLVLVGVFVVSFAAERVLPYRSEWNEPRADGSRDAAHAIVNEGLQVLSLLALPTIVDVLAIDGIWPQGWPYFVQVVIAVLVVDAGITFGHRLSHHVGALWRLHSVHHSVTRLYGFNGLMKHPLHQLFETAAATALLVVLGLPSDVATAVAVAVSVQLLLQHSNVDYFVPTPARWLLALNVVHRFHHLKWAGIGDTNFGLFTNLWDRLMRTAVWDPQRTFHSDVIGIADEPDYPVAYGAQLIEPFRRSIK